MLLAITAKKNFLQMFLEHKKLNLSYTSIITILKRYLAKLKAVRMMKRMDLLLNANAQNVVTCKCLTLRYNFVLPMRGKPCSSHVSNASLRNRKTHKQNNVSTPSFKSPSVDFLFSCAKHARYYLILNATVKCFNISLIGRPFSLFIFILFLL